MNFSELKTEFYARGTDYLNEDAQGVARAERWLNQAYREIVNLHAWPFLQTVATGAADAGFVVVPDLRKILYVTDSSGGQNPGTPLKRVSIEDLQAESANVSQTGTPELYWLDGAETIMAYPVGGTISVRYVKRVAPMTGTDVPIFDEEYHNLIVDKAMIKAYVDSDNFEAAAALRDEVNLTLSAMAEDYLLASRETQYILVNPYDG
jgi:hypothetical protein